MEATFSNKHSSLPWHGSNYDRKKFYPVSRLKLGFATSLFALKEREKNDNKNKKFLPWHSRKLLRTSYDHNFGWGPYCKRDHCVSV